MRGIYYAGDKPEYTDAIEVRDLRPDEVRVRIRAAGLCHSDVSVLDGTIPFPTPVVLGHEGAGEVEAVGDGVVGHRGRRPRRAVHARQLRALLAV